VPLLWLLLPGVLSLAVGRLLSADLNGRGLPGSVARVNVAMALVNIALNLWWIPIWGAAGSAAATSISYGTAVILLGLRYRRVSGIGWRELLLLTRSERAELARAVARSPRGRPPDRAGREPNS
jgi:O-antigen/teichoic acid export membrane protein